METTQIGDSTQIKGPVKEYLLGNIGRRSFLRRLTATGLTATAARQYMELLASPAATPRVPAAGEGTEVRISAPGVIAGGLVAEGQGGHLAAFNAPAETNRRSQDDRGFERMQTRRRRMGG